MVIAEVNDVSRACPTPAGPTELGRTGWPVAGHPSGWRSAHALARSTSRSPAAPRARGPSSSPAHHRPASWVRRLSAPVEDVAVAGQERAGGDEVSGVLV